MRRFFFLTVFLIFPFLVIFAIPEACADYSALYERDLFRLKPEVVPEPPPEPEPEPEPLPKPEPRPEPPGLDQFLSLKGVIVSEPSLALIEDKRTGRISVHEKGSRISGGRVIRVGARNVVVADDSGREFELSLEMSADLPAGALADSPPARRPSRGEREREPPVISRPERDPGEPPVPGPGDYAGDDERAVSLADVTRKMMESQEDLRRLQVMPVVKDGQVSGYQVRNLSGQLAEMADQYGFREGDIVTRINREPVRSLSDIIGAYRSTGPGSPVSVTVERDGEILNFRFRVEQ